MKEQGGKAIVERALAEGRACLSEHEAKLVLASYGIPVAKEQVVRTPEELVRALKSFEYPVVLKIDSPDIPHKTEAGLVELNCRNLHEADAAFTRIMQRARQGCPKARINGVLVQEMVTDCTECIVGMKRDAQFGPTIMFGLGGIFVEVFQDVSLRVAPLTELDAAQMIQEVKGYKILAGARGRPRADVEAVKDVLLKMSHLSLDLEEYILEADINPLMVGSSGQSVKAVDALMVLNK